MRLRHHPDSMIHTSPREETPHKTSELGGHLNLSQTCNLIVIHINLYLSHTFSQNADVLLNDELIALLLQKQISSGPTSLHINPIGLMPRGGRSTCPSRCDWVRPEP